MVAFRNLFKVMCVGKAGFITKSSECDAFRLFETN